jgi:dTDP-4-dehydrorhamnose 3,5-epimerase
MTLNLVVPIGSIRFVVYDNSKDSSTAGNFEEIILSTEHYARLTVPPKLWVGFQGVGKGTNLLLNIANIPHNDTEVDHTPLKSFGYDWIQE